MKDQNLKAPESSRLPTRWYAVIGAHGGAGVTTVTRLLDPSRDGSAVELQPGAALPHSYIPIVVARSTAYGLLKASELLGRWHPGLPRPYLVLVRDAPLRPPLPARYRTRVLGARTLGVATVPYLYRLRLVDTPEEALTHRPVARASSSLRAQLGVTA